MRDIMPLHPGWVTPTGIDSWIPPCGIIAPAQIAIPEFGVISPGK